MEGKLKTQIYGMTDPGMVRERNEDAVSWDSADGWAVLADGMGGHLAGDVASRLAVTTLEQQFRGMAAEGSTDVAAERVAAAVVEANRLIHDQAEADIHCHNMGATLEAALFTGDMLISAHVGDSRLYRYRGEELVQLSHDHSLVQELVDEGMMSREEAAASSHKNVITRALGLEERVEVDLMQFPLSAGDIYLFCSDGLSDKLSDSEMGAFLQGEELMDIAQALVNEANARGGEDNISVILVRIAEEAIQG